MAQYRFCLIAVTLLGAWSCQGQRSTQDTTDMEEKEMPSLAKEVEDNSRYKTLEANATLLKLLVDNKDGVSKFEVFDMLHSRDKDQNHVDTGADVPAAPDAQVEFLQKMSSIIGMGSEVFDMLHSRDEDQDHVDLPMFPEDEDTGDDVPTAPNAQVEILQATSSIVRKDSMRSRHTAARGEPIGAAAGIMVVITCSIVCLGYIAVVVWRKIYLKRNGLKHELLKNEDNVAETRLDF